MKSSEESLVDLYTFQAKVGMVTKSLTLNPKLILEDVLAKSRTMTAKISIRERIIFKD